MKTQQTQCAEKFSKKCTSAFTRYLHLHRTQNTSTSFANPPMSWYGADSWNLFSTIRSSILTIVTSAMHILGNLVDLGGYSLIFGDTYELQNPKFVSGSYGVGVLVYSIKILSKPSKGCVICIYSDERYVFCTFIGIFIDFQRKLLYSSLRKRFLDDLAWILFFI